MKSEKPKDDLNNLLPFLKKYVKRINEQHILARNSFIDTTYDDFSLSLAYILSDLNKEIRKEIKVLTDKKTKRRNEYT